VKSSRILGPVFLFALWLGLASSGLVSPLILPQPFAVIQAGYSLLVGTGELWSHIGLTAYRTLLSFTLSCLIGIPVGLLMGFMPFVHTALDFLVDFFRSIPPIALFPLFLLVFGIGEASRLAVPFYGCVLVIIVNSSYGVANVPALRRTVGRVYGFSNAQVFWKIVVPDSLPQVFAGMRTAVSLALVLAIVVEMFIGSPSGLGKKIYDYHLLFETPKLYATVGITGLFGYLLNQGFLRLERHIVHWADK